MLPYSVPPDSSGSVPDRPARADRRSDRRLRSNRGLTIVEVAFASAILAFVMCGVLQAMLQSRRMTEGSVRLSSVASLVQGYLEQLKSIKYGDLPLSPSTTPTGATTTAWAPYSISVLDSNQSTTNPIYLAIGSAPTAVPAISSLATDISMRTEQVDIDNINSAADNSVMNMWVWINDMADTSDTTRVNVVNCRSIVIVYQWTSRDGGRVRYFSDMSRTIRSMVPTD
jgi:hypothetical protein